MANTTAQEPKDIPVFRTRGDTRALVFHFTEDGADKDITGFSYRLTVSTEATPDTDTNKVFAINGVIAVGTDGLVSFPFLLSEEDQTPATYYYDIKETDVASTTLTVVKSTWEVAQDITKD